MDASSALGIDGTVDIQSPITNLDDKLGPLPEDFMNAVELLREPCLVRAQGGRYSSFVISPSSGTGIEPGGLLPSPPRFLNMDVEAVN